MLKTLLVFVCGALIGALAVWKLPALGQTAGKDPADPAKADVAKIDLKALNDDVARLKSIVPSNSHIMEDVSFHYSNLWFAGQKKNWPLAMFYFNETRNHIRWLIQKSPTAKTRRSRQLARHLRRNRYEQSGNAEEVNRGQEQ